MRRGAYLGIFIPSVLRPARRAQTISDCFSEARSLSWDLHPKCLEGRATHKKLLIAFRVLIAFHVRWFHENPTLFHSENHSFLEAKIFVVVINPRMMWILKSENGILAVWI